MNIIQHIGFKELVVSLDEFLYLLKPENKKILGTYLNSSEHKFIYRGHSNSDYLLNPALFRNVFDYNPSASFADFCFRQFVYLKQFVIGCDLGGVSIPNDSHDFRKKYLNAYKGTELYNPRKWPDKALYELLGFAQHYGYPTELLDWSYNPLVAIYFAASGVISNTDSKIDGSMCVWVFDLEKENALNSCNVTNFEVINIPKSLNQNISSQNGCFTVVRQEILRDEKLLFEEKRYKNFKLLPDLMNEKEQKEGLLKISVSNINVLDILEFCSDYFINAASLFRGPNGAARYACEEISKTRFASKNNIDLGGIPI